MHMSNVHLKPCCRLKRDVESRGREVAGALKQYHRFVKPSYDAFIKPSMQHADLVIPRGTNAWAYWHGGC
jgi:uridine kinase